MNYVVDTNVAIAANGRDTHASHECQYRCIDFLQRLAEKDGAHEVFLDEDGTIMDQYADYLNFRGQPGVGDLFFRYLHDHMYANGRVRRVSVTRLNDDTRGFAELPPNDLDRADRVFLAVAVAHGPTIVNALDSDWHERRVLTTELGVHVLELCPDHVT